MVVALGVDGAAVAFLVVFFLVVFFLVVFFGALVFGFGAAVVTVVFVCGFGAFVPRAFVFGALGLGTVVFGAAATPPPATDARARSNGKATHGCKEAVLAE